MFTEGCHLSTCGGKVCGGAIWMVLGTVGVGGIIFGGIFGGCFEWSPMAIGCIVGGSLAFAGGVAGLVFVRRAIVLELVERNSLLKGFNNPFRNDNL